MLRLYRHGSSLSGLAGRRSARSPTVVGAAALSNLSNRCLFLRRGGYSCPHQPDAPVRVQARSQVAQQLQPDACTDDAARAFVGTASAHTEQPPLRRTTTTPQGRGLCTGLWMIQINMLLNGRVFVDKRRCG